MAVMVSSLQRRQIYDPIRKKWMDALPEEIVRQKILSHLVNQLGYPPCAIVVEKKLSELSQVLEENVPSRRIDILCLESETLRPLLLVECKAVPLQEKMFAQALGYNAYIKAPLICLANDEEFLLRWENDSSIKERNQLPTYESLKNAR
jgi:hypothetical protein